MTKIERLKKLYESYTGDFDKGEIVPGDGNVNSQMILIGEAPGKDEIKLGRPFVGMAGKNLSEFLGILGIDRDDIYITNAIKYRLSKINPKTNKVINKPATKQDIEENRKYLLEEIEIVNARYLITLGNVPLKCVTGESSISIGEVHGEITTVSVAGMDYLLFPLYHPASIIYNRSLKDVYISDINKLKEIIQDQRGIRD